jgi:ATPase family associated with various cellular activities (AAA)
MPNATLAPLFDIAKDLLAAQRGDTDASRRMLRRAVPLAADLLVRPGAGMFVSRGLEVWDEYQAYKAADQHPEDDDEPESTTHPMDRFVQRLLSKRFGFYVVGGEPGTGKTTLALRIAERFATERGYGVVAVGGLHPDDRRRWRTDGWIASEHPEGYIKAMQAIAAAMVEGVEYPREIKRRVILLDDASLSAHASQAGMTRALLRTWNAYRHLDWIVILTARTFKSISTVAEGADALFLKRPAWDALVAEREEARGWWEEAERAFASLKHSDEWTFFPSEKEWVYARSERLRYKGPLRYTVPQGTAEVEEDD